MRNPLQEYDFPFRVVNGAVVFAAEQNEIV
jgi:hypothetical protein